MRAVIVVLGIVQGVGFRPFVYRLAVASDLKGYVRNRGDAGIEIVVEGAEEIISRFLQELRERKPPLAKILDIKVRYEESHDEFDSFKILDSSEKAEFPGSIIPPDVSICDDCARELREEGNRRKDYFFITCTNCGPRYTIIDRLPYDRPNTTMRSFNMCESCRKDYTNPLDRRFHAQTVACSDCGPRVWLCTNRGEELPLQDPIREAGKMLEEGYIIAVKGNGGFHLAAATTKSEPVIRLRKAKERRQKPFAIMARDLKAARSFAEISEYEASLLSSPMKPIVLLRKSERYYLSDEISPGLNTIGTMLPYTGLHLMLFDRVSEPAFIMTSGNAPDEPIIVENSEAIRRLGGTVNYLLLHDREISQRCDDSVVRLHGDNPCIIRRSRGYAPEPLLLRIDDSRSVLAVGPELNVTTCLLTRRRAFLSQHIGDVEDERTYHFLKVTVDHLIRLTHSQVDLIACDLHPKFVTTMLARELGERFSCTVTQVQHHYAHIAALMAEHGVESMVGISCDGFGYGDDGSAWGGEVLLCDSSGYKRIGHLEPQPLVGLDLAAKFPLRMAAGCLYNSVDISEWLLSCSEYFPHKEREVEVVLAQLKRGNLPKTTSLGRILDAIAAILGICYERTYEGEPAMKLESAAAGGRDILAYPPIILDNVLETSTLIRRIFEEKERARVRDLAYSAEAYLARGLAELAIMKADELGIENIGFTGGVAYNEHIASTIVTRIRDEGFKAYLHRDVPPGDAGVSLGQAIAAIWRQR